jgi:hypothetical protein
VERSTFVVTVQVKQWSFTAVPTQNVGVALFLFTFFFFFFTFEYLRIPTRQSHWLCGLTRRSAAACLLRLQVRISPGHRCVSLASVMCCPVEVSPSG